MHWQKVTGTFTGWYACCTVNFYWIHLANITLIDFIASKYSIELNDILLGFNCYLELGDEFFLMELGNEFLLMELGDEFFFDGAW